MKVFSFEEVESSEIVRQSFNFWFSDNGHIRSPFPAEIISTLKINSILQFQNWLNNLPSQVKKEEIDNVIIEKFEEFLFESGLSLVQNEDQKISINYPFLPRIGDKINKEQEDDEHEILDRRIVHEKDHSYLWIEAKSLNTQQLWETKIELPV